MILTTAFTIPLLSIIYPKPMYSTPNLTSKSLSIQQLPRLDASGSAETLAESIIRSPSFKDLTFLVYLPNMSTVPSLMSLVSLFQKGIRKVSMSALRLLKLSGRESSVLMATETKYTQELMDADPIMSLVSTFGRLNQVNIKPLFAVSGSSNAASEVFKASQESHSNLILFPWFPSSTSSAAMTSNEGNDAMDEDMIQEVIATARCSVALFCDRGFGMGASSSEPVDSSSSFDDIPPGVVKVKPRTVLLVLCGGRDDFESLSLVSYLISNSSLRLSILLLQTPKMSTEIQDAARLLAGHPDVSLTIMDMNGQHTRQIFLKENGQGLTGKDLVVLGRSEYVDSEDVKEWIETEIQASVILIQHHRMTSKAAQLQA